MVAKCLKKILLLLFITGEMCIRDSGIGYLDLVLPYGFTATLKANMGYICTKMGFSYEENPKI